MKKLKVMLDHIDHARDNREVILSLREVEIVLSPQEREELSMDRTIDPCLNLVQRLIVAVINVKFQGGIGRKDGQFWVPWQRGLSAGSTMRIPAGSVRWMLELLTDENLDVPWQLANTRESFIDYLGKQLEDAGTSTALVAS